MGEQPVEQGPTRSPAPRDERPGEQQPGRLPARPRKVVLIVCDSLGIGAAPDAADYGDAGSNTIAHTAAAVGGLRLPNLGAWGIGRLTGIEGVPPAEPAAAVVARMAERSAGKDTTTGHWEMMGIVLPEPFPTYPDGFPAEVIDAFSEAIGLPVLGNVPASGTEIIKQLGEEHLATGRPIVYTSADSVFQIAAHKQVVPLERLYQWCEIARRLLTGPNAVGRVIARPFDGEPGSFFRTKERRDYALPPAGPTVLEAVEKAGVRTLGVGKIEDIFSGRGLAGSDHTGDNQSSLDATVRFLRDAEAPTFVFTNLVDFDMVYGHRRDAPGYARCLEELDARLPEVVAQLGQHDWLLLSADHGCDPTAPGTDHTRELVPMVAFSPGGTSGAHLADRTTFADLGATIADLFRVDPVGPGRSFASDLTG
ncbi:MAG TPA: phosphopentomutase [Actinomycetota bacterium]